MKGNKKKSFFLILIAVVVVIASVTLYMVFNPLNSQDEVKLNLFEQRWIENNKNTIIDVFIPNGVPLYTSDGKGIIFSFLEYFETKTELEFNKTPYTIGEDANIKDNMFRVIRGDEKLKNNDLLFYSDNYVVVSRDNQSKVNLDSFDASVGVLDVDFNVVSSYLDGKTLKITKVNEIVELVDMFDKEEFSYIIIPKNMYLDMIIEKGYYIINTLNDLSLKYVLTLVEDNNRLNDIIKKYYDVWTEDYLTDTYQVELFNLYTNINQIGDKSKTDFKSKRYIYGYVDTYPYEYSSNDEIKGLSNEFITSFSSFSGVEFNFKRYNNASDLNKALEKGEIDIASNYYNLNTSNAYKTIDLLYSDYVILSTDSNLIVDTIKSLNEKVIYTIKNTKIASYINKNGRFNIKTVDHVSNLSGKDLILLDANVYTYYKDSYLEEYSVVYRNVAGDNYSYLINKKESNQLFYNIFNYYLSTLNHQQYKSIGMNKALTKGFDFDLSLLWLYVILIPIFIGIVITILRRRKKIIKVRNDVKLKYIDPLTSLKNRYYLNNNITKWEENNIYPQAMIIINVNNLKDINDAYGHEGGDKLIKTAANILINNQLEKTDIVRTDGNEFIIYMVGYEESEVIAYVRKLYRLLKDLPYEYGASLGYSMIEDDIKTIEDAINEAILDMVTNREAKKNNEV